MTASTVRPMKDLHDGVYRYKTYRLEDLIPPKDAGDLIAVATDGARRVVTYVASPQGPELTWRALQVLELPPPETPETP